MSAKPIHSEEQEAPASSCYVPTEQAREDVRKAREGVIRWIPILVTGLLAVGSNAVFVAYLFGKVEQRIVPVENYVAAHSYDRLVASFVTRTEFTSRTTQRDREMESLYDWLKRVESKIDKTDSKVDRLLEARSARSD